MTRGSGTGTEPVGGKTLREKLEAPAVIRSIIAASARVVDLLDERRLLHDEEMLEAATALRTKLVELEAMRTGAT